MKKQIAMTSAMAAALLTLPGCSQDNGWEEVTAEKDTAVCVDQEGTRVEDAQCERQPATRSGGGGSGVATAFLWYYIGRNSRVPFYGDSVRDPRYSGGTYARSQGVQYERAPASTRIPRSAAVSRGGLGSRGSFFGSGSGRS